MFQYERQTMPKLVREGSNFTHNMKQAIWEIKLDFHNKWTNYRAPQMGHRNLGYRSRTHGQRVMGRELYEREVPFYCLGSTSSQSLENVHSSAAVPRSYLASH